jgi:hypothetical protein
VALHVVALGLAAVGMRPGTALVSLAERMDYLAQSPAGWTLGWAAWMLCSATLILFLAAVTHRLENRTGLASFGLMIAIAGAAFDLFCDSIYVVVFPMLAALRPQQQDLFLIVEKTTGLASLVIANGGYSVGILLITFALRERKGLMPFTVMIGYAVAGFGLLLAAAGFTGVPWHAEWATPPTIGLFCLWAVLVAHSLEPARRHM